jgi:MFS family permease
MPARTVGGTVPTQTGEHPMDRHFARNAAGISLVELFWGLGMPAVFESTFIPLFMRGMGASSLLIGLVPTLLSTGVAIAAFSAWFLTAGRRRKKAMVVAVHLVAALPLLGFGLFLHATGTRPSTLVVFLAAYAAYSLAIGLVLPMWQNYTVKIFSERNTVRAIGIMILTQNAARLVGAFVILRIVERFAVSAPGAALVFTATVALFLVGSLPFLFTVEDAGSSSPAPATRPNLASIRRVVADRSFLSFLATEVEYVALGTVIAFYANYATEFGGVAPATASGLFVMLSSLGGMAANAAFGWADLGSLRTKYVLAKSGALAGILLMAFLSTPWVFLLASVLLGVSRGTRAVVYAPAIKRLAGTAEATPYFAVAPVLTLPLSLGLPLAGGAFLDATAGLGAWSYRIVFLAMAAVSAVGLCFAARMKATPAAPPPAR